MEFRLESARVFRAHLTAIAVLLLAHLAVATLRAVTGRPNAMGLVPLFDLNSENNVPTLFSALAILGAAALLWATGAAARRAGEPGARIWQALGLLFVALALDESLALHERLSTPLRAVLHVGGAFHFAWVIPYFAGVVALAIVLRRFLLGLEPQLRRNLFVAAAVFLSGALVLEVLGSWISSTVGRRAPLYVAEVTVEEMLEMTGIALLVRALLSYHERRFGRRPPA